ncbi:hypothetical protein E4U17_005701 [Claviceps sp. LM77 group G4]|nr:hypothetical protein E4U17_005701 [Claviceps sp. LM77 group G4]KAG6065178.1 hypothetical protein E4U33_005938 [Claviceps sp. LM78 group G4]KAG6071662.1 hypothetical protein E4U16_005983 [Claviceps sp. LM84 group G4]
MLFAVFVPLLSVSARHVDGHVVAPSIRGQEYDPATVKDSVLSSSLEHELHLQRTRQQHMRGVGATTSPYTAGDVPGLRISPRDTEDEPVTVVNISLRSLDEGVAGSRAIDPEQPLTPQAVSYLPTPSASVILAAEKDKLWNTITLVTGICATLVSCIALGVLFMWICRRNHHRRSRKDCHRHVSTTKKSLHRHTKSGASTQTHELAVPERPSPTWQLASYRAMSHKEQQAWSKSPTWTRPRHHHHHHIVSPIDSQDGSTPLRNLYVARVHPGNGNPSLPFQSATVANLPLSHPSPIESNDIIIQQPPASYHWQAPAELPATTRSADEHTSLPTYKEASVVRFSWAQGAEASYRPSERLKN